MCREERTWNLIAERDSYEKIDSISGKRTEIVSYKSINWKIFSGALFLFVTSSGNLNKLMAPSFDIIVKHFSLTVSDAENT